MAGIGKCMGIMGAGSFIVGSAVSYYYGNKAAKITIEHAPTDKNGNIPIGGMTKDGTLWDGKISVDEYKKKLSNSVKISSLVTGVLTMLGTAVVSGLTLLLRGKVK